jgi:hypothetical protein
MKAAPFRMLLFALALVAQGFFGGFGVAVAPASDHPLSYGRDCVSAPQQNDDASHLRYHQGCFFCQGCQTGFSPLESSLANYELISFRETSRLSFQTAFFAPPASRTAQAHRARAPPASS